MMIGLKDILTLLNAVSGVVGISLAIVSHPLAWVYVFFAVLFDFLDGRIARKGKPNAFGKELDSLADTVSFIVAPAVLVMLFNKADILLTGLSALYVCTGLLRLAWFNLQKEKKHYFGLPSPVAALVVVLINVFAAQFIEITLLLAAIAMVIPVKIKKF